MSNIRRQSIVSSILIYSGFAFGALNTYLFVKEGGFTKEQYGLTGAFMAIGSMIMALAALGMPGFINKFFPYYKDRLQKKDNDLATWALVISTIGFVLVAILGFFMKGVVNKVYANSPLLIEYYYWIFPFGLGLTLFAVLEGIAWHNHKSVLSNYLKEVQFRVLVTVLFVLFSMGVIRDFDKFIKIYAFLYLFLAFALFFYLIGTGKLYLTFKKSKVTRRFLPKIITLSGFIWGGTLVYTAATVSDTIIIMAILPNGVEMAGLFTFAQYLTSLIQDRRSFCCTSVAGMER
jgi:O-antigen/teichoic acid export membrane protein